MFFKHGRLEKELREHGRTATAQVLHAKTEGEIQGVKAIFADDDDLSTGAILYRLKLRVMPKNEPHFEVTVHTRSHTMLLQGETVPVMYDPDDHERVVVDYKLDYQRQVDAANAPKADGDVIYADVQSRMQQLEDMHARGVLSDADFQTEQAKIIDDI